MLKSILSPFRTSLRLPKYGLLYFDHLLGLFGVLAQKITDPVDKKVLDEARAKRENNELEWKDIYSFDLILLKYLEIGQLKSRVLTLRSQYRNIAGQKEYDAYLALKPPDAASTSDEKVLRQDIEYLLNEFYLRYSLTSSREHLRSQLLKFAAGFTVVFLAAGAILVKINSDPALAQRLGANEGVNTISVVIFAGIVGAFISMQQRIQSAPSEGDPIYNFSVLTHGVFGIFLSPITGAIFAVVLYLMFTAGILQGSAFPIIKTTAAADAPASSITLLGTFSKGTGPASGKDYALLLIWAFIAGFAERFVPDALNRMVVKSEAEQVPTT
jgi:hypothetical protein